MATVTGFTAARMQEIEDASVIGAHITGDDLVLETHDGGTIVVGSLRGPQGDVGPSNADVGDVKTSILSTISGWILMGTTITSANTNWPDLWAVAPASWKSGTTLNLPVMTDTFVQGGGTIGAITGANTKVLLASNLPPHSHIAANHTHPVAQHTHPIAHVHTISHTHEHVHTHTMTHDHGVFNTSGHSVNHVHNINSRFNSTAGNTAYMMAASSVGTIASPDRQTDGADVSHTHQVDVPNWVGNTGGASDATTGQPSTANSGNPSNANSGLAGPTVTGSDGGDATGNGPGTSTPVDIQPRALRLNYFIYPGVHG
jgi:hypothetical protein